MGKYDKMVENENIDRFLRVIANELAEANRLRRSQINEHRDSDYVEVDEA